MIYLQYKVTLMYMALLSPRTKLNFAHWATLTLIYRVSQELRSLLRDLIPDLILSQKRHIHMGQIGNGSGVMVF
jgi:hypothetical protein